MSASLNVRRRSMAGKTAQKPSQYRHALQITIRRSPSAIRLSSGGTGRLPSRDLSEHRSDRHAKPGEIALADNVARHDFSGREDIRGRTESLHLGAFVHPHAEIRERYPRPERISIEGRFVVGMRLVRFR